LFLSMVKRQYANRGRLGMFDFERLN